MENEDPLLVYNKFLDIENEVRKYVKFQGNENRHQTYKLFFMQCCIIL